MPRKRGATSSIQDPVPRRPASLAYSRALSELQRVLDLSVHQSDQALQLLGIVMAAVLVSLGALASHAPLERDVPVAAATIGTLGAGAFSAGVWQLYEAVFRRRIEGSLHPQRLLQHLEYLEDDAAFERDSLPAVTRAFTLNLASSTEQAYQVHRAGRIIGVGVILLAASIVCYAALSRPPHGRGAVVSKRPSMQIRLKRPTSAALRARLRSSVTAAKPHEESTAVPIRDVFDTYTIWGGGGDTPKPVRK